MENKHMHEKNVQITGHWENHIKTTVRYYLATTRISTLRRKAEITNVEKLEPWTWLVGM